MTIKQRFFAYTFAMIIILLAIMYANLHTGFSDMSNADLIRILFGGGNAVEHITVFDFRLVRTVLAVFIGMGLAMSGAIFQTVSRNELASPSLLGVNAGAGLGVVLLVYFAGSTTAWGIWTLPTVAVAGAILAALLIYALSCRGGEVISPYRLILTGISMSAGFHALQVLLVTRLDPNKFYLVNTWTIGTISGNTWEHVWILAPVVVILSLILYARYMDLNLLSLADETAMGLGVRINLSRFIYLIIAVLLAGFCVAIGGSIGFVGLISPHIARRLIGANHAYFLPLTALIGAILVVGADWIGRSIIAPDEILLGIIIALVGAPYFLYILAKTKV